MGVGPLSKEWRRAVCAILRTHDKNRIVLTLRAQSDFSVYFPDLWENDLHNGLIQHLEQDYCEGRQVLTMDEPGEVYEFIFTFHARRLYAKLNLTPHGELVIVYSAHPPLKGDSL